MTEKICVNGHTIDEGQTICSRCGSGTAPEVKEPVEEEAVDEKPTEEVKSEASEATESEEVNEEEKTEDAPEATEAPAVENAEATPKPESDVPQTDNENEPANTGQLGTAAPEEEKDVPTDPEAESEKPVQE